MPSHIDQALFVKQIEIVEIWTGQLFQANLIDHLQRVLHLSGDPPGGSFHVRHQAAINFV